RNVVINCSPYCNIANNITYIIERGNLYIKSNLNYSAGGMLGIIMIGNPGNGTKSQVYIDEGITNGVGTIYTDGSIQSSYYNGTNDVNIYTPSNINNRGLNQLYWQGSFISKNTLGGSIGTLKCPYGSVNYTTCSTEKIAKKYDLLFFRRYKLVDKIFYPLVTGTTSPFPSGKIPLGIDGFTSIKITGGREYNISGGSITNISTISGLKQITEWEKAFILDYDPRLQSNPPLGFETK
ncbi:MAG: hypothetical protein PHY51_02065, partial [Candidatus Gracilibacteria bacterium]|nr:hypothetical protein [Candidatus Gracilibacteria bacterium]